MDGHIYLNSSLVGMPPERVLAASRTFMDDYVSTFNASIKTDLLAKRNMAKEKIAQLIHADPSEIIWQKNVTEANATFAMGFDGLSPGTNAIILDCDFPNTILPWINAHHVRGFNLKVYKSIRGQVPARDLIAMMDDNTRVVAVAAVQSGWGHFVDLKALGEECRKRGIAFFVDAYQALGRVNIDVKECCIDYLTCAGAKTLMGTWGASFVYATKEIANRITPPTAGYQSAKRHTMAPGVCEEFDEIDFKEGSARLEAGGQCTYAIEAMGLGVDLILELGKENVQEHVLGLERVFREGLSKLPLDVITPEDPARMSSMVVLLFPEEHTDRLKKIFEERKIYATVRPGYIRFTIALFNTEEDIQITLEALKELCNGF